MNKELLNIRIRCENALENVYFKILQKNNRFLYDKKLTQFLKGNRNERFILTLTLLPHIKPHFFDDLLPPKGNHPQIGGIRGKQHRGFLPTGETALWLLAGDDLENRFEVQQLFSPAHFFAKERILWLAPPENNEPPMSGQLVMNPEYVELFTTGKIAHPPFSMSFPAERLETKMEWDELILPTSTISQLEELRNWLDHQDILMEDWGMHRKIKPGYRALFYGPPGTGKTLAAKLLGKTFDLPVFRVDLSMVVSKYIGETEKNLANLFARASGKNWILFFDEADALFGKRTNVRDAHDKYANQEVAYLLQRVEHYNGLVILASNFKSNIDEAFLRRFQSIIHFPMPSVIERFQLWQHSIPEKLKLSDDVDFKIIAKKYEISGASIINVIQYCSLNAIKKGNSIVNQEELIKGIQREFIKEGKAII